MGSGENKERKFQCFHCGVCCTRYQVYMTLTEAKDLAAHLGVSLKKFLRSYTDPRWPGNETFLIHHQNGACVFLKRMQGDKVTQCLIYAYRPQDCRSWMPEMNKPECQQGLSMWGLEVSPTGKLRGTIENLKRFELFMESQDVE